MQADSDNEMKLFDYASFSMKFLNEMYDWQQKGGCQPPDCSGGWRGLLILPGRCPREFAFGIYRMEVQYDREIADSCY